MELNLHMVKFESVWVKKIFQAAYEAKNKLRHKNSS